MKDILVVEDNRPMREMLETILTEKGYRVSTAADVSSAMMLLRQVHFPVILSDLQLPDMDGINFLKRVKSLNIPFIIITAYGSIAKAVEAIKIGAFDFIAKPVDPDYLFLIIEKALAANKLQRENIIFRQFHSSEADSTVIIGQSRGLKLEAEKIRQVAPTDTPVLLLGESGTGKELFARSLHFISPRAAEPFIALNAASIPEPLLENELFGHEKGSYTDAYSQQIGKLELAQGGTFFLDEIGDLPHTLQGKLLRVLEDRSIRRIGSNREIKLQLRFVFATNRDLEQAVAAGHFRKDLYFRISAFPIHIPPLRERSEDIILLADYFMRRFAREMKKPLPELSEPARHKLENYSWPGNVRELQNIIERAVIVSTDSHISPEEIVLPEKSPDLAEKIDFRGGLKEVTARAVRFTEKIKISQALTVSGWNRNQAAKSLGISYRTLLEKIKEYGIKQKE